MASSFTDENIDPSLLTMDPNMDPTRSADECQALVYAGVLQVLDLAKKNDNDTVWTIPPNLHQWIVKYVCAFVFSPTTVCYCGINVGEHILKAMRECNVKNLLEEDDIIAVGLVLALICSKGTHYQNTFKTKVKASMAHNSSMCDIATLSHKLLKDTGVKPTVQFYQCVAFIRWCLSNYPNLSEEDFWPKGVDNSIAMFRHQHKTQEELDAYVFSSVLLHFMLMIIQPEDTDLTTVDFSTTPDWQVTLGEHTKNIQPQPVFKKHKIGEVEDDDDEGGK
ncbi:hypothetical protein DFH08DRAFT_961511 [Mycena albidolilacea]|uniref:Uncharacterized protein n=1 Tax=Mycena albidolilacea TaxID=1033008 RepID=A0AAD7A0J2_9AGAR|nr:hypothetical protein DFH08DRAFT_961511 [Mycena albidolilacea]